MLVCAISVEGKEYLYKSSTAHKVSKASAARICAALNKVRYNLKEGEVWYIHEVDNYDNASVYAEAQSFKVYRGGLREVIG